MVITFDPRKRDETLADRGLDFLTAAEVFEGGTLDIRDLRRDYGEDRIISVGFLRGRMVIVVWTPRGEARHVISMRKADGREQARYADRFGADRRPRRLGPGI
ncbi:BrnT family toxin [Lichenibacterium dinghuense]|uniref:BrnT family toxin n=1 Tax=Lichenibacterium dinghuense TaxID=2895977 RepID=UPI001F1DB3DD|nr:BrnT family toxin [Lichenibacterium sp. 6Y81]